MPTTLQVTKPAEEHYLKVLIYGPFGAGKTTLAGSAETIAQMCDVLYIDVESGSLSLVGQDIDVLRINAYQDFSQIYEFLRLHCRYRDAKEGAKGLADANARIGALPDKRYRTVVIDSLTEVQKTLMYMLLGTSIGGTRLDLIPESPEWKEWGQSAEMIRLLVRSFRDLPMHVIFVCSEQEVQDGGNLVRRPNLPGKLSGEVQGFLDVVGYLRAAPASEDGTVMRRLYITPGRTFSAKHRFRNVNVDFIEDVTMDDLYNLLTRKA